MGNNFSSTPVKRRQTHTLAKGSLIMHIRPSATMYVYINRDLENNIY